MTENDMKLLTASYLDGMRYDRKGQSSLKKLLSDKKNEGFLFFIVDFDYDFNRAFKETVLHVVSGKSEALSRMKGFAAYLHQNGLEFEMKWPPINDIGNRYERIVYMLRELQTLEKEKCGDERSAVRYLSDRLWVSERTIEDDFSFMMPPRDVTASKSIFQHSLAINGMTRSKGVFRFASTAHPIFLIENLSSVLVIMESLLEKARVVPYREQAMTTARRIWKQLTPYAQARIAELLRQNYSADAEQLKCFSRMIDTNDMENNAFVTEKVVHNDPESNLFDSMKMEIPCEVEYLFNGWEHGKWIGIVKGDQIRNDSFSIGDELIPYDDIIAVKLIES